METHRKFQRKSLFFRPPDFPTLRFFVSKSSPEMFSILETQPQKKHFVRSGNSGLPQNGYRKMASENISAHDDRNDLTGNRRPCPPADLLKPLPNCDSKNGALRATEPFKQKTVFYCNSREKYRREWF